MKSTVTLGKIKSVESLSWNNPPSRVWVQSEKYPRGIEIDVRTEYRVVWSEGGFPTTPLHEASEWALRKRVKALTAKSVEA